MATFVILKGGRLFDTIRPEYQKRKHMTDSIQQTFTFALRSNLECFCHEVIFLIYSQFLLVTLQFFIVLNISTFTAPRNLKLRSRKIKEIHPQQQKNSPILLVTEPLLYILYLGLVADQKGIHLYSEDLRHH